MFLGIKLLYSTLCISFVDGIGMLFGVLDLAKKNYKMMYNGKQNIHGKFIQYHRNAKRARYGIRL